MSEIKVRKGGKIVRVTENELEKYLIKGYTIIEQGHAEILRGPATIEDKPKRRNKVKK